MGLSDHGILLEDSSTARARSGFDGKKGGHFDYRVERGMPQFSKNYEDVSLRKSGVFSPAGTGASIRFSGGGSGHAKSGL